MRTPPQWGEPAGPNGGAASHADARCRRDWRRHIEGSMTIERGTSNPNRASFRCLNLACTLLALACGGNDVGPTSPPTVTGVGSSTVHATVIAAGPTVATTGNVFSPARVYISPGEKVTWTFSGLHNVTFSSSALRIPNTSSGSVSRTFCHVGFYYYRCTIHPSMTGSVYVRP